MTLSEFKSFLVNGLKKHRVSVYHRKAAKIADNYVVWGEVGKNSLRADGGTAEYSYMAAVDFYTKSEYSSVPDVIEGIFENNEISYGDATIIYEDDTGFTHYAWTVEF